MNIIPRTLGVSEIMSVPVHSEIITAQLFAEMAHNGVTGYSVNCYIDSCAMTNDFPLEHIAIAINNSDNMAQLVGIGPKTQDGAIPTVSVYYCSKRPEYSQWEMNTIEQMQAVVGDFNRIVRQIRALEKGSENDLPIQTE